MSEYIIQGDTLNCLADAVREKAGISNDMTTDEIIREIYLLETDTDTGAPSTGVIFYDYDGTVLHSYTVKEARALTALPNGPVHDGLPFVGWTHTLEEVNSTMKILHVGAMYEPENTRLMITLDTYNTQNGVKIYFNQTVSNGVTINWGDGNSDTVSGTGDVNVKHVYSDSYNGLECIIEFIVNSGTFKIGGNYSVFYDTDADVERRKKSVLTDAIIGSNTTISTGAFVSCSALKSLVISKGCTISGLAQQAFYDCGITCVILPTNSKIMGNMFGRCEQLETFVIPEGTTFGLQNSYSAFWFLYCKNLKTIILPSSCVLDYGAFKNSGVSTVYYKRATPPQKTNATSIFDTSTLKTIYVPVQSLEEYKTSTYWSDIADKIKGMPM